MQEYKVHQVITNSDLTEWKWGKVVVANFSNQEVAELVKVGKWVMGTDGEVEKVVIRIYDTLEEYQDLTWDFPREEIKKIKENALSKLTKREKKVLWL